MSPRTDTASSLRLRWVLACAAGEALGLTASGVLGALVTPTLLGGPATHPAVLHGLMIVAGTVEGSIFGVAQWLVLRRALPGVPFSSWVSTTAAGFAIGWLIGTAVSLIEPAEIPSRVSVLVVAAATGLALGAVVGLLQSRVLSRCASRSPAWAPITALSWSVGMVASVLGAEALGDGEYVWPHVAIALASGALVGLVVGAFTAFSLPSAAATRASTPSAGKRSS